MEHYVWSADGSHALSYGDVRAPGIVFVHGTRMAGAYWHPQLVALADSYHVVAPDLPGHGANRAVPFSHAAALETIRSAVRACAGGTAVIVGHSLGGYLAVDLAAQLPQFCRGLVLAGCTAVARGPRTWPYSAIVRLLPLVSESTLTHWNDRLLRRLYPGALVEAQIAAGYSFRAVGPSWQAVLGRDHAAALRKFQGPVLVINGSRDRLFRLDERYFLRSCVNGQLKVLNGAGHLSNYDRPAEFTAALRAFMDSIPPLAA